MMELLQEFKIELPKPDKNDWLIPNIYIQFKMNLLAGTWVKEYGQYMEQYMVSK